MAPKLMQMPIVILSLLVGGVAIAETPAGPCARMLSMGGYQFDFVNDCKFRVYWRVTCKFNTPNCYAPPSVFFIEAGSHSLKDLTAASSALDYRGAYKE